MKKEDLIELLKPFGQEHLVKFWDELNESEKEILINEIIQLDFLDLNSTFKRVKAEMNEESKEIDGLMKPVPKELKGNFSKSSKAQLNTFESEGYKAIVNGEVYI